MLSSANQFLPSAHCHDDHRTSPPINAVFFHPDSAPSPAQRRYRTRITTFGHTSTKDRYSIMAASSAAHPSHPGVFFSTTPSSKAKAQNASAQIKNETNFNTFRMTPPPSTSYRRRTQITSASQSTNNSCLSSDPVSSPPSTSTISSSQPALSCPLLTLGEKVLQTPRKGRRLGGVQMGWESPHRSSPNSISGPASAHSQSAASAHTVPLSTAASSATPSSKTMRDRGVDAPHESNPVSVTPRKRRSPQDQGGSSPVSSPTKRTHHVELESAPSLHNQEGYAMAVCPSSIRLANRRHAAEDSPSLFDAPPTAPARFDRLAAFRSEVVAAPSDCSHHQQSSSRPSKLPCNLIAVDVKGMGRVAVAREVAVQLGAMSEGELKASQADLDGAGDFMHPIGSFAIDGFSSSYGYRSHLGPPTSLDTPGYSMHSAGHLGPSPSFSLASHFPMSEDGSPSLWAGSRKSRTRSRLDTFILERVLAFKDKLSGAAQSAVIRSTTQASLLQPETVAIVPEVMAPSSSSLPTLAWPDVPVHRWSSSSESLQTRAEARLAVVSRWLDDDDDGREGDEDGWTADDETAQPDNVQRTLVRTRSQIHPMIAKAVRDRHRKVALASSASMPDLHSSAYTELRRRERKSRDGRKPTRGRPRKELKTPVKRHAFTPSSLGRSVISSGGLSDGSRVGCLCGDAREDSPMVQCDGCQVWYHMRCARIRRPEDLGETWYCPPCVVDPSTSQTRRLMAVSPSSTIALADLHASGGSRATSTPGMLVSGPQGNLTAFPRTYASQFGVSTPSAAYSGVKAEQLDRLPVFAHEDSPAHMASRGLSAALVPSSSSLALAPSPVLDTGDGSAMLSRRHVRGRSRASRIGWRTAEPGSPLDRKSTVALSSFSSTASGISTLPSVTCDSAARSYGVKQHTSNARGDGQSEEEDLPGSHTMSPSFYNDLRNRAVGPQRGVDARTPSPTRHAAVATATPSRHARSGRGDSDLDADHPGRRGSPDALSTPSRLWYGSSKNGVASAFCQGSSTPVNGLVPLSLQTPSRSTRQREPSGWALSLANFSTPGSTRDRDLLFGQQNGTDISGGYSSGLPSLIYSSGSVVGGGNGLGPVASEDFPDTHWLNAERLGSPSRSLRRRQRSQFVGPLSAAMIGDEAVRRANVLTSQAETTSTRTAMTATPQSSAQRRRQVSSGRPLDDSSDCYDERSHGHMDPPTSSSPYPRTPSVDLGYSSANRLNTRGSGGASTPSSPTPSRGKTTLGPFGAGRGGNQHQYGGTNFRKSMSMNAGLANADAVGVSIKNSARRPLSTDLNSTSRVRQASAQHFDAAGPNGLGLGLDLEDVLQFY